MTDFSTEILPEEEEKAEQLLPKQDDLQDPRRAVALPAETDGKPGPVPASPGNAVLARQLGKPKAEPKMAAKPVPVPVPEKDPPPDPNLKEEAEQPKADPAVEREQRQKLLTRTLSRLLQTPESAPIDALFNAFVKAPMDEQADAALAIANAVLRIDADTRRRARIVLAGVMTAHQAHPLAQILAIRLGAWVSTRPAPPPSPDPGVGP